MTNFNIQDNPIKYIKGGKKQLTEDAVFEIDILPSKDIVTEFVELGADGILLIKRGFFWDGASGPTIDTPSVHRGACIHDALYRLFQKGHLTEESDRRKADRILYDYLRHDGMWKFRAKVWHRSLRRWGMKSSMRVKKIFTAPK